MSTRETSPEIAALAGRILAAGNPLDNDQVVLDLRDRLSKANTGKQAQEALKTMFQPYFDNMLSLAGSCLSQAKDDDDAVPRTALTAKVDWDKITNARREFRILRRESRTGKSRIMVECPFCRFHFWAYIWSISGGGKKCENKECGAMHTSSGFAYPVEGRENPNG